MSQRCLMCWGAGRNQLDGTICFCQQYTFQTLTLIEPPFNVKKKAHLKNLEDIKSFIFGDQNNQPQVTNHRVMLEFEELYTKMKKWIEESYDENDEGVQ